jgi:hypothetical protein
MGAFSVVLLLLTAQGLTTSSIPAGTSVRARLESPVETATSNAGDAVVAIMTQPLRREGKIIVPEGSRLNGRVETVSSATQTSEGRVRLAFRDIQFPDGRTTSTWITHSFSASPPKRKLRYGLYMGIGAAAGAMIGGKSARTAGIIGGTLAGFVIAGNSESDKLPDLVLKPGRMLTLRLGEDLLLD